MTVTIRHRGTKEQQGFWDDPAKFRAFVGGIGSGKTFAGCIEVLRQPSGSRGMIVAPTYRMLTDSTLETFRKIAGPVVQDYNKSDMTMKLINGAEILWRSADNPDSLRGPNLGWFWGDEFAMLPTDETWDILIGRLRLLPSRGWVTTSPRGFNWLYHTFHNREGYSLINCSSRSNSFLPDGFVASLEAKYGGSWAAQEIEGEFAEWTDSPCYTFRREVNTEKGLAERYDPVRPLILCCDFNVRFMSWPYAQVVKGEPRVLGEVTFPPAGKVESVSIADMVRLFRNRFPAHPGGVTVYGDASGHGRDAQTAKSDYDIMQLEFRGYSSPVTFNVPRSNPQVKDRINAVNRLLRGADGAPRLRIDADGCPELIQDLLQVEWDSTGTKEKQYGDPKDMRSRRTHSSCGLGGWIWREYPLRSELATRKALQPIRTGTLLGTVG